MVGFSVLQESYFGIEGNLLQKQVFLLIVWTLKYRKGTVLEHRWADYDFKSA